jgi:hypothetical protein
MKNYYVRIPTWAGPLRVYGYDRKDALKRFKQAQGFIRMPKGYGIWEIAQ